MRELLVACCTAAVAWTISGCGPSPDVLLPVSGMVLAEGGPVSNGWVIFIADDSRNNTRASRPMAVIEGDGSYEMATMQKTGVPLGWYKVVVIAANEPIPKQLAVRDGELWQPRGGWPMSEKYLTEQTTDLAVEVVKNPGPGQYDLKLTR